MKPPRFTHLLAAAIIALLATSVARSAGPLPTEASAATDPDTSETSLWLKIKDSPFDLRADFFAGFARMDARLDVQIKELVDRRAAMKSIANTKDWDFAMKELGNARSYLSGTGKLAAKAIPESWTQDKERVGQAWVRAQNAYLKVKASTTN